MTTPTFCEQCGSPLGEGLAFCESCGAAVPGDQPGASVTDPVAAASEAPVATPPPEPAPAAAAAPVAPATAATATAATATAVSAGRGSPKWVPLVILLVGVVMIIASIASAL